jgi:RNA polymerase sigma-70 factor, ECF subfamily
LWFSARVGQEQAAGTTKRVSNRALETIHGPPRNHLHAGTVSIDADEMTEEALMAAYCDGDRAAFERLFAALGPRVHGFFLRSFHSEAVADDLMQTTFLRLHRAREDYHRDQPLRPWVFAIAARVRLDEYRRRKRAPEDLDDEALARAEEAGTRQGPEADSAAGQRAETVRAALDALPESQRLIVHLHRYEAMTFAEIGRVLGTTEGAVKLRAFRAYERLRKQLAPLVGKDRRP